MENAFDKTVLKALLYMKQDDIITLHTFNDILQASLAADALKASHIESFVADETKSGINPFVGVELKVFSKDKETADKIVAGYKD